jgi:hypothetical protein
LTSFPQVVEDVIDAGCADRSLPDDRLQTPSCFIFSEIPSSDAVDIEDDHIFTEPQSLLEGS